MGGCFAFFLGSLRGDVFLVMFFFYCFFFWLFFSFLKLCVIVGYYNFATTLKMLPIT